jgi:agmatinase
MTSLQPLPTFAPPGTPYLASSLEVVGPSSDGVATRAAAAIFGVPLDLTESFRGGAHGGPAAVRFMSDGLETYSPMLDRDLEERDVRDFGDVSLDSMGVETALESVAAAMAFAARSARLAVMLGGEHLGSLGGFRGVRRVHYDAVILQADAHLDMRPDYEGQALTHATWLHHVGREFGFKIIHQVGLRSGTRNEWARAKRETAWSSRELNLPLEVRQRIGHRPVYVSIDIDVLDPAHAPGTGCPEPGGATFRELANFLYGLDGLNVVALDVMEVSPNLDAANITAAAAAKLVREAILLFGG